MRIGLITEELSFGKGSGGIGGAFHELSLTLKKHGHVVDVIYLPIDLEKQNPCPDLLNYYENHGIGVITPDISQYVWQPPSYERRSYALFRYLYDSEVAYDYVHFHDYKGLGYFSLAAKQQQLAFPETVIVVQVHGPTRWTLEANGHPFTHEDQLKIDFMERESIARADMLVSPSAYMLEWLQQNGWETPPRDRVHIIQNVCTHLRTLIEPAKCEVVPGPQKEIIFFGRHEERKGLVSFCDALDLIRDELIAADALVSFLGAFGVINGESSALYLADRATTWRFPIRVLPDLDRILAARYLAGSERSVVVIPSPVENSPYTVLEAIIVGKPLITSSQGGAKELLDASCARALICEVNRLDLAAKLREAIGTGLASAKAAVSPDETQQLWLALHNGPGTTPSRVSEKGNKVTPGHKIHAQPKVMAAITHYERPEKLYEAIISLATQSYHDLELVVVDDGSRSSTVLQSLECLKPLLEKLQVRLIYQENKYLGAARNRAVEETDSDYVLFLDDDDIAFPNLIQTLVRAAEATNADIVNCVNLFMPESRRGEAYPFPDRFQQKVSYVPLGGPLSMAPLENCYGAATALIRRTAFHKLGGYTEEYGVGHEDYELYVRALQMKLRIEICPFPLYLYEVDRPSMALSTSRLRNWNRVIQAIDMSVRDKSWLDLVSVNAGRRAQEHTENYAIYRIKTSPHCSLLEQIMGTPTMSADYAQLVSEYANRVGALTYAQAMNRLAIDRSAAGLRANGTKSIMLPPLDSESGRRVRRSSVADSLLLGGLVDLSFDRITDAVRLFNLSRERETGPLTQAQSQFLKRLCRHTNATPADLRFVLDSFRRMPLRVDEFQQTAATIFHLALRTGDAPFALRVFDCAMAADEQIYLAANPGVSEAVSSGSFASMLEHFVHVGQNQPQHGFALIREIKEALRTELRVDPPIFMLRQYLTTLVQAQSAGREHKKSDPVMVSQADPTRARRSNGSATQRTIVNGG